MSAEARGDANSGTSMDPILTLASSLDAIPGSHAVLLGAGASIAAGVPSAWGVLLQLIQRVAAMERVDEPADPREWFSSSYGHEPTYERLLEQLAPTQTARQGLLREFFEPDANDGTGERPRPSPGHIALADLAEAGAIKVFLTLNFDHLMEQALREIGIEPVVVRSVDDIIGLAPLHTLGVTVIHLHGDYKMPTSMLNTVDELSRYDPRLTSFLERLLHDYSLLIVGWSAEYDTALRSAIQNGLLERFVSYWIDRAPLRPHARELADSKRITFIQADGNVELGRLADAFRAVRSRRMRHPLTIADAVHAVKRSVGGGRPAIDVHDRLRRELSRLRELPEMNSRNESPELGSYSDRVDRLIEASLPAAGLIAALAYWGEPATDKWWLGELRRFSGRSGTSGIVSILELPAIVGTILYQAAAVGSILAERFDLLAQLFTADAELLDGRYETLAHRLAAAHGFAQRTAPSADVLEILRTIFAEQLSLGNRAFIDAWETHDVLLMVRELVSDALFTEVQAKLANAREDVRNNTNLETHRADLAEAQARLELAGRVWARGHVRANRGNNRYVAVRADDLAHQVQREGVAHPIAATFPSLDAGQLVDALEAVSAAVGEKSRADARAEIRPNQEAMYILEFRWLDTGKRPD